VNGPVTVAGVEVPPGVRRDLTPLASESYTGDRTTLPLAVLNGVEDGPRVFVTAAVHGDELNGIAICRELLGRVAPERLAGVLVVVPIVNVLGAQIHSRYLPDRRDLNRSFPGTHTGSMASRIARLLMDEVVRSSDAGIDLHTAANRRTNVPQLRVEVGDRRALELARAFAPPYVLDASLRSGSLRSVLHELGVPVLTYEAGEPLRFDERAIEVGVQGCLRVLEHLGMIDEAPPADAPAVEMHESRWLRAERGGIIDLQVGPGEPVEAGQELWVTTSPLGAERAVVESPLDGIVIGATTLPLVSPGEAILHIGVPGDRPSAEDDPSAEEDADDDTDLDL
jgi:uncharacterized protein